MSYQRQENNNYKQGKADVPNKVKFSSVRLSQTKQGSPTATFYLKQDQAAKLIELLSELLESGADGAKLSAVVIEGKDYNSGYAYVDKKESRGEQNQARGGFANKAKGKFGDKTNAREYLAKKRFNDNSTSET